MTRQLFRVRVVRDVVRAADLSLVRGWCWTCPACRRVSVGVHDLPLIQSRARTHAHLCPLLRAANRAALERRKVVAA